jgi:tRNA(Arg) A34 adenosine deaminase TadA
MVVSHPDRALMARAIEVAQESAAAGDYRLGALVAGPEGVLVEAYTDLEATQDPTAHAEVLAIRKAAVKRGSRYLADCYLYTTLEPCPMCTSAGIWAKMAGIVFGATLEDILERGGEWRDGEFFSWRQIKVKSSYVVQRGTPVLDLHEGFMRSECLTLLPSPP